MLAKPFPNHSPAGKGAFHPHNSTASSRQMLSIHLTKSGVLFWPIYPESTGLGRTALPAWQERFNSSALFLPAIAPAPACLARSRKTAASAAASRGQGFAPPTGARVRFQFLRSLDWLAPLLMVSSFPAGKGWEAKLATPLTPLQHGNIMVFILSSKSCVFKAFSV